MENAVFGAMPDGRDVERIRLTGGGLTAHFLTYGAVLQDLRLEGHDAPLVLGFKEFAPYLTHSPYFGAIAGRCANRIRDGHLELDGKTYQLDRNFLGKHHLHGGAASLGKRLWRIEAQSASCLSLQIELADGEMGYPGNMQVRARFELLPGGVLDIRLEATADATTLCNLAHHSYFNLDGSDSIAGHELRVAAQAYLPVDEELIPSGEQRSVAGTAFDFTQGTALGPVIRSQRIDHNFCLRSSRGSLQPAAWLRGGKNGVMMECRTTEPGLQIYDGAKISIDLPGLTGRAMGANAGLAMEPQVWPDANHHGGFPQAILRAGDIYLQQTQYDFSIN